jgi:DNA invertase Pin-like site-specific DNA recombinase
VTLDGDEQPQKQDVVVADASELGSSLPKIVVEIERITADGGTLTITSGPLAGREGELLALAPALAAAHRSLVLPKLAAALGAAREQGRKGGRPKALDAEKLAQLAELVESGASIPDAAVIMGVSRATAYRALAGAE